jgi:hypothetical protein
VAFDQVPAAGTDDERGHRVAQPVLLALGAGEVDPPLDGVGQVDLAADHVGPGRGVGVLEVGHEDPRARVQGVDQHLPLGRPGDLRAPVGERGRRRRDPPVRVLADSPGLGEKVQPPRAGRLGAALRAAVEQLPPPRLEAPVQVGEEGERLGGEHLVLALDGRTGHGGVGCHASPFPSAAGSCTFGVSW